MQPLKKLAYSSQRALTCGLETADTEDILPFVYARFRAVHDARVIRLLPNQFTLRDAEGLLLAVAGFQTAHGHALFLEHYLDEPVHKAVARQLQRPVSRADIVELGNLAAVGGHTPTLILAMMRYLAASSCRYVVFTLTAQVRATFRRMGLPLIALTEASPDRVPQPETWGAYYDKQPLVMVGDIAAGLAALDANPALAQALAAQPTLEGMPCSLS
ncbi:thermostable hemolysin [Chitinimonas sp. JJ19]|uniref:thermostable hemolysin n=1 Tax=Chitinimonas sp. JJ19 TaxID=3109352 RepID=UPI001A425345|nr:thermostable hemolysin [Chitinimonas sp.]